jgi:uncharacterized protein (UPF0335 family)
MTAAASGGNDLAAKAETYLRQIEEIDFDLESEKGEYMSRCRVLRDKRKDVFGAAKDDGIQVKPLKAVVKRRKLENKIAGLPSDFDIDESSQYAALAEAFAGTPFGDFAAARGGAAEKVNGAEEAPRPDEEHLQKIGRGRGKKKLADEVADAVDQLAN